MTLALAALALSLVGGDSSVKWTALMEPGVGGAMVDISVSPHDSKRVLVTGDMLGIGVSADRGKTWGPTFGLKSYEMASVTWHPTNPSIVWCGSMAGPYLSQDGGKNWELKRKGFPEMSDWSYTAPIEKVLFDPADSKRLLAFGGSVRRWGATNGKPLWGVVWESRDGGEHWTRMTTLTEKGSDSSPSAQGKNIIEAAFVPGEKAKLYSLLDGAGFFVSTDGGKDWEKKSNGLPHGTVERLAINPKNGKIAYVSLNNIKVGDAMKPGGVFMTRDGGETWVSRGTGLSQHVGEDGNSTARYGGLAISSSDPNVLIASETSWNLGAIYRSTDGGATWKISATGQNIGQEAAKELKGAFNPEIATFAGFSMGDLEIDPQDPKIAFAINTETILKTLDGGKTWVDASAEKVGSGWRGTGYTGWVTRSIAFDPHTKGRSILTAMDAGRAWVSVDGFHSWKYGEGFPYPWMCGAGAVYSSGNRAYAAFGQFSSFQGVGRSDDGGKSWKVLAGASHGLPELGAGIDPYAIYAPPDRPDEVAVIIGAKMWISFDGGGSFATPKFPGGGVYDVKESGKKWYLASDSGLWTYEKGKGFAPLGGPKGANQIAITGNGIVYTTSKETERSGVWKFAAGKWSRILDERYVGGIAVDPGDHRRIVVTTNEDPYMDLSPAVGILMSGDGGRTWGQENEGLPMKRTQPAAFNPFDREEIVVGTGGRGFFRARWPVGYLPSGRSYVSTPEDEEWAKIRPVPSSTIGIKNGSMTDGTDTPSEWNSFWQGKPKLTVTRDTSSFQKGPASLKITGEGDAEGQAGQAFEVQGSVKLKVTGWAKSSGLKVVSVGVQSLNASWTPLATGQVKFLTGNQDWRRFEAVVTTDPASVRAQIVVFIQGQGSAWLDEVEVVELPQ